MLDDFQALILPRGMGKSTAVAHWVCQAQDEGASLVVVIIPSAAHSNHLALMLLPPSGEVDPSRLMLLTPHGIDGLRGLPRDTAIAVEEFSYDYYKREGFERVAHDLLLFDGPQLVTITDALSEIRRESERFLDRQ